MHTISQVLRSTMILMILFVTSSYLSSSAYAADDYFKKYAVNVVFNDKPVEFEPNAIAWNNNTMVPFRQLFEEFGAEVKWDSEAKTVTAVKGDIKVQLTLGSFQAFINNKEYKLTQTPFVAKNSVLVNLRFVSEALGAEVSFVKAKMTVYLNWEEKV